MRWNANPIHVQFILGVLNKNGIPKKGKTMVNIEWIEEIDAC